MKTSKLTGAALDWAVAKCEGHNVFIKHAPLQVMYTPKGKRSFYIYTPSTNWSQGGPIIERENICLWSEGYDWEAKIQTASGEWLAEWDESPLIAAMRCYVASKLGDDIDVPPELV
jgi:hypothetical protein